MNLDWSFYKLSLIQDFVFSGFWFSLKLTIVATLGGMLVGTLLALMRMSGKPWLAGPAAVYVTGMRSVPAIMVILWFFLLVPTAFYSLLPGGADRRAEYSAYITFIAFEAAYFGEVIRAGIQSIRRGQVSAGAALGMTYAQNLRFVILPQAVKNMLPIILTQIIILFQDTSLVYVIGAYDMLKGFETAGRYFGRPIEAYLLAAVCYFLLCYALSRIAKTLNKRMEYAR